MKKVIGLSKYIIFLLLVLPLLISCGKEEETGPRWDVYNPLFVNYFSNDDDIEDINVSELIAYYHNEHYYYTVKYTQDNTDDETFIYELLYILSDYNGIPEKEIFFPIKDEKDCYRHFPDYYKRFLDAKENGVSKTFTQEEISKMINDFYGREIK